ncbi:DUF2806 domain-containing protein [Commensalibacter intestini]|nr:DUF2806 domain-containing protein [Commensalibacter intestini]
MSYSKLFERMWLTVEKCGGSYFRPRIIKRDGKARLELEALEKLMAVQIEKRINLLKQDTTNTNIDINALERIVNQDLKSIDLEEKIKKEPYLEYTKHIHHHLTDNIMRKEFQKEVNFAKAIDIAAGILSQDESEPPKEQVEQDWLCRFREVASNTTTEEIQQLWGRILAGEIKSPGKHSLRTLEFIKNLSQKEAKQIEKLFSFVIDDNAIMKGLEFGSRYGNDVLNSKLSYEHLYDMQSLGVITGVGWVLGVEVKPTYDKEVKYYRICFKTCNCLWGSYIFKHNNSDAQLTFDSYKLTKLGEELYDLCHVEIDGDYLNYVVKVMEEQGFKKVPKI